MGAARCRRGHERLLPWNRVSHRLRNAECYWLSTTRPDGRPHSMPVWGLWDDESLWFGTCLESVNARNLAHLPYAVAASPPRPVIAFRPRADRHGARESVGPTMEDDRAGPSARSASNECRIA